MQTLDALGSALQYLYTFVKTMLVVRKNIAHYATLALYTAYFAMFQFCPLLYTRCQLHQNSLRDYFPRIHFLVRISFGILECLIYFMFWILEYLIYFMSWPLEFLCRIVSWTLDCLIILLRIVSWILDCPFIILLALESTVRQGLHSRTRLGWFSSTVGLPHKTI